MQYPYASILYYSIFPIKNRTVRELLKRSGKIPRLFRRVVAGQLFLQYAVPIAIYGI